MKQFKGTPGPWEVTGPCCDGVGADFDNTSHKSVCQRPARTGGKLTDEYNANMHLIAAAPDLLEALQIICFYEDIPQGQRDIAEAAIAKALGEEDEHN